MNCKFKARTPYKPTEDLNRVIQAISNLFDYDSLEIDEEEVIVKGDVRSLQKLQEALEKRRIRSAARRIMSKNTVQGKFRFLLNKQAALVGVVNLVEDDETSPLGDIEVEIETDNIEELLDWLCVPVDE